MITRMKPDITTTRRPRRSGAPRLAGPQHWVVHDRDAGLLELAVANAPGSVEARESDITRLAPGELADASAIVASASKSSSMRSADTAARGTIIAMNVPIITATRICRRY